MFSINSHMDLVLTSLSWIVGDIINAITLINNFWIWSSRIWSFHLDFKFTLARRFNGEFTIFFGNTFNQTRSIGTGLRCVGKSLFSWLSITEVTDIRHYSVLINLWMVQLLREDNLRHTKILFGSVHTFFGFLVLVTISRMIGAQTRFECIGESTNKLTVIPIFAKIVDVIAIRCVFTNFRTNPFEQFILGTTITRGTFTHMISQNNGPNETKNDLHVAFNNITCTNIDGLDAFFFQKLKRNVDVFHLLDRNTWMLIVLW
mmetsp:Transcript_20674/g.30729  ORF Transcript_20674/g.30729 Transcript_20674/m.30729 type:complete len:260 (-) Transcript_20674:242-1021(-)